MHEAATVKPNKTPAHMTFDPNSAEWWSRWSDWLKIAGFILGGFVTVIAVAGWAFSLKAGKLKDEASKLKDAALDRYKQESAQAIAEADAKAAEANKLAALANARAATSELELEKIKLGLGPRTISEEQKKVFLESATRFPRGKISVSYSDTDQETPSFALALAKMIAEAGYDIPLSHREMGKFSGMPVSVGILIQAGDRMDMVAAGLQESLLAAGFDPDGEVRPEFNGVTLVVGVKPK